MASSLNFVEFICEQIGSKGIATYKKMFGEYMVYLNAKPIFLICEDTLYIKQLKEVQPLLADCPLGCPYKGAKEHFIAENIEDRAWMETLAECLEKVTPLPKPKKKKS